MTKDEWTALSLPVYPTDFIDVRPKINGPLIMGLLEIVVVFSVARPGQMLLIPLILFLAYTIFQAKALRSLRQMSELDRKKADLGLMKSASIFVTATITLVLVLFSLRLF